MQFFILILGVPFFGINMKESSAELCALCAVQCSMFCIFVLRFLYIPLLSQFSFSFSNYMCFVSFSLTSALTLVAFSFSSLSLPSCILVHYLSHISFFVCCICGCCASFFFVFFALFIRILSFVFYPPHSSTTYEPLAFVRFLSLSIACARCACLCVCLCAYYIFCTQFLLYLKILLVVEAFESRFTCECFACLFVLLTTRPLRSYLHTARPLPPRRPPLHILYSDLTEYVRGNEACNNIYENVNSCTFLFFFRALSLALTFALSLSACRPFCITFRSTKYCCWWVFSLSSRLVFFMFLFYWISSMYRHSHVCIWYSEFHGEEYRVCTMPDILSDRVSFVCVCV